jgi:fructose-1,6-bisphosphatase/inositol monophosphatase family enzyme
VLDPIDGTAPFIAGVPVYGTLISLMVGGRPILGIIEMAATADRWTGAQGRATRHTVGLVRTGACLSLDNAILTSSNPDMRLPLTVSAACGRAAGAAGYVYAPTLAETVAEVCDSILPTVSPAYVRCASSPGQAAL